MHAACYGGHLSVCQWLVLNSALNDPTSEQVDEAIVQEAASWISGDTESKLLSWARDMIDTHDTFLNVFLRASVILPASQQHAHPSARCLLPRLHRAVLERVSWFAGVEVGRRVRNVREFKEALEALDQEESDGNEALEALDSDEDEGEDLLENAEQDYQHLSLIHI